MTSLDEDKEFFNLLKEILDIEETFGSDNQPPLRIVHPEEKKKQLEKRRAELLDKYMVFLIELDRVRIREAPYPMNHLVDFLQGHAYCSLDINTAWDNYSQDILDYHQDNELIDRGRFVRNYFKLTPPYIKVGTRIPEGIQNIYHESRWCFVYGQYNAAVALCRTVIETVLRTKFHLYGDLNEVIKTAKERRLISDKTQWHANGVRILANKILHQAETISEKEAKDAIGYILVFLQEIYL
jgi:hypothetical protein